MPFKILAAPDVSTRLYQSLLDWSPAYTPGFPEFDDQKLAIALHDAIYIARPLDADLGMTKIDFNRNR